MYGGTKTEMERLVTDAEKLNKKFKATRDENGKVTLSFSEIVEAIHIVQQDMGITGTSAEEAGATIQGSMATVKAAWQDVLTAMGSGKNLDAKLDNFEQSFSTYAENLMPILEGALKGAAGTVEKLAPTFAEKFPKLVADIAPSVFSAGATIVTNLGSGILKELKKSNFNDKAKELTTKVNEMISKVDFNKGGQEFGAIIDKIIDAAFNIVSTFDVTEAATSLTDWLNGAIDKIDFNKLGNTVSTAFEGVWKFIKTALDNIDWEDIGNAISSFINGIDWRGILNAMFATIGTIIKKAPELLKGVVENLDFVSAADTLAILFVPKIASKILTKFKTDPTVKTDLTSAGKTAGEKINGGMKGSFSGAASGLIGKIGGALKTAGVIAEAFAAGWALGSLIKKGLDAIGIGEWIDEQVIKVTSVFTAAADAKSTLTNVKSSNAQKLNDFKKKGVDWLTETDIENGTDAFRKASHILGLMKSHPELEKAGITARTIMNNVGLYNDLLAGKVPDWIKKAAKTSGGSSGFDPSQYMPHSPSRAGDLGSSVNSDISVNVNSPIYIDKNKLVGHTQGAYSDASGKQYDITKRGVTT